MDFTRQSNICAPWIIQSKSVNLIGTGGIGSAAAVVLAKLGIGHINLFDPDEVEEVNIPTQLLRVSDVGMAKVESVWRLLQILSDVSVMARASEIDENAQMPWAPICISALDSVEARQRVWWRMRVMQPNWYLDARMAAEVFQLYTVNMRDYHWYEDALMSLTEDMVPDEPCTSKAIIYTAFIAAGHIGHAVKRIVMDQPVPHLLVHNIKLFDITRP